MRRLLGVLALLLISSSAFAQFQPTFTRYATTDPTTLQCSPGQRWYNINANSTWECKVNQSPSPSWVQTNAGGGGGTFPLSSVSGLNSVVLTGDAATQLSALTVTDGTELVGWNAGLGLNKGFSVFGTFNEGFVSYVGAAPDSTPTLTASVAAGSNTASHTITSASVTTNVNDGANAVHTIAETDGGTTNTVAVTGEAQAEYTQTSQQFQLIAQNLEDNSFGRTLTNTAQAYQQVDNGAGLSTQHEISAGGARYNNSGAKPTCDNASRGHMWRTEGGVGVADTYEVCLKDSTNSFAWRSMVGVLP